MSENMNNIENKKSQYKKVFCYETKIIYNSIREAYKKLNIQRRGIRRCCENKQETASGYHFCYIENIDTTIKIIKSKNNHYVIPIFCYELNKSFNSIDEAYYNIKDFNMSSLDSFRVGVRNATKHWRLFKGYHWCILPDKNKFIEYCKSNGIKIGLKNQREKFNGVIYKITCLINNKIYIGQTTHIIKERLKEHFNSAFRIDRKNFNHKFSNAIRKYGKENFIIEVIDRAYNSKELNEKEIYWISYFKSVEKGYNTENGGYGKPHNKKLFSQNISSSSSNKKQVYCFELNKVFDSLYDTEKKLNLNRNAVSKACRGIQNNVKGYHFCFLEDKEKYKLCLTHDEKLKYIGDKIYCFEMDKSFECKKDIYDFFVEKYNENASYKTFKTIIGQGCNNWNMLVRGYHWCKIQDKEKFLQYLKYNNIERKYIYNEEYNIKTENIYLMAQKMRIQSAGIKLVCEKIKESYNGLHFRYVNIDYKNDNYNPEDYKIYCFEEDTIYNNIFELKKKYPEYKTDDIIKNCQGIRKSIYGKHFCYHKNKEKYNYKLHGTKIKVKCIEINKVFDCLSDASKFLNKSDDSVRWSYRKYGKNSITGIWEYAGYHWEIIK